MHKLNNKGDTIVEVLISLAILSLAFAISYSTASRALELSQNAQEHSTALGILNKEIEMIWYESQPSNRGTSTQTNIFNSSYFCLYDTETPGKVQVNYKLLNLSQTPANNSFPSVGCDFPGAGFNYRVIVYRNTDTFTAYIWWQGLGSLGVQSEHLSYRIYQNE